MAEVTLGIPKVQLAPIVVLPKLATEMHQKTCPQCGWVVSCRSRENMLIAYREHIHVVHKQVWAA